MLVPVRATARRRGATVAARKRPACMIPRGMPCRIQHPSGWAAGAWWQHSTEDL